MRHRLLLAALLAAFAVTGPAVSSADACPMCKAANESQSPTGEKNTKPQAFMYSILFMLTMPATLLGTFGYTFWRMSNRPEDSDEMLPADEAGEQP